MPVYDLRNNETGEEWEEKMSYEDMKELTADGAIRIVYKQVNFVHATGSDGGGNVPDHFKEVMSKISEANPNSPLAQQYGKKDHKAIKTRDAVEKARKKAGGSLIG